MMPDEAISLFAEAITLGVSAADYAADRGLAYDLKGENRLAQRDYDLALRYRSDDKVTRRLALSLGITGDREAALTLLAPLVQKNDQAAWRARAFILAMNGQLAEAERIANDATPSELAGAMNPFLERLARLTPSQRAHAVHFGTMPPAGIRYAITETSEPFRPVTLAEPHPPTLDKTVTDVRGLPISLPVPDARETKLRERRERELAKIASRSKSLSEAVAPVPAKKAPGLMPQTQAVIDELLRPKSVVAEKRPEPSPVPEPEKMVAQSRTTVVDTITERDVPPVFEVQPARRVETVALPASGLAPVQLRIAQERSPETAAFAPDPVIAPTRESGLRPVSRLAALLDGIEVEQETVAAEVPADDILKATRAANRKKLAAEAKATAIKAAEAKQLADEKAKIKQHPARHWVQIATGANRAGLPGTWRKMKGDAPKTLDGQSAASVPFKSTNRLLVGPFKSASEARAMVNKLAKDGISANTFSSDAGQEIAKIGGK